jgi:hypothetical protein
MPLEPGREGDRTDVSELRALEAMGDVRRETARDFIRRDF